MDLRNKTTSEFRTVSYSPFGVPNSPNSEVSLYIKWGTFDLLVFNVILGSFSALVSIWPATRIWLTGE